MFALCYANFCADAGITGLAWCEGIANMLLGSLMVTWVIGDMARRGRRAPYDTDTFLYMTAPLAIPAYLLWTRRWRGLLVVVGFLILWLMMAVAADLCVSLAPE